MRITGRGYRDGLRSLQVMVESLSGGSRPEIQEEGRVMELKIFCSSILGGREERQTGEAKCDLIRLWMSQRF